MKKYYSAFPFLFTAVLVITFSFANAQSQSESMSAGGSQAPVVSSVQFNVSIPNDYSSYIIREEGDNAVYFKFKKSDGTSLFLFQVNKIQEGQWMLIKGQLVDPVMLAHKNGFIYYAQTTDKSRIKGSDAAMYQQIHDQLHQLINSIVITE